MENNKIAENSLKTLRGFLFDEIIKIREGKAINQESIAISKLSSQIINSYKAEIEAVKAANELKDKNISYKDKLSAINPRIGN